MPTSSLLVPVILNRSKRISVVSLTPSPFGVNTGGTAMTDAISGASTKFETTTSVWPRTRELASPSLASPSLSSDQAPLPPCPFA